MLNCLEQDAPCYAIVLVHRVGPNRMLMATGGNYAPKSLPDWTSQSACWGEEKIPGCLGTTEPGAG
jgi:hypothetical protein